MVNTLTAYAARGFGTPAAVFSVSVAILSWPSSTSYSFSAHCATIGGFTTTTWTVAALAGAAAGT